MPSTIRIGTIAGARFEAHFSWIIALALMVGTLAFGWLPQVAPDLSPTADLLLGVVGAMLFFALALAHDLGHVLGARYRERTLTRTVLYPWGGVYTLEEPVTPTDEAQVALGGPLLSLAIGVAASLLIPLYYTSSTWIALLTTVQYTSILLGLVNLLPGLPLDMGHVLRGFLRTQREVATPRTPAPPDAEHVLRYHSIREHRDANEIAWLVGRVIAAGLLLWGIVQAATGHGIAALWLIGVGIALLAQPGPASPVAA
ncbi:MAG TPA: hypothetical protein VF807_15330, partial [Ktedonobacterales bacterium]